MLDDKENANFFPVIANEVLENEPIIRETADQVIKDFRLYDVHIQFLGEGKTPYVELFDQILPHIQDMLLTDSGTLYALLYTIDIPDHWWKQLKQESDTLSLSITLTDLILKRELLKVLTRMKFRQGRLDLDGNA